MHNNGGTFSYVALMPRLSLLRAAPFTFLSSLQSQAAILLSELTLHVRHRHCVLARALSLLETLLSFIVFMKLK